MARFFQMSFFITLATAISKSYWVTWILLSLRANIPASVQTAFDQAPLAPPIFSAIFLKSMPLTKFIFLECILRISSLDQLILYIDTWIRELDFPIDPSRPQQSRVEDIYSVRCHYDLYVLTGLEPVQLVQQLQHCPLHFRVSSRSLNSISANRIHFVDENNTRGVLSRHNEQLSNHPCALADVFLDQLASGDSDEGAVSMMSDSPGQESLASARRPIHEHSLGLGDTQ